MSLPGLRHLRGALLVLGLALVAPRAGATVVDRIAAVVDKEVITLSEVYDLGGEYILQAAGSMGEDSAARRAAELEVLQTLVQRTLVGQEIRRLGLDVTQEELDRAIDDIARQNNMDRERLRTEVERSGLPWSTYRDELRESIRQMKFNQVVLQPRIRIADDDVQDLYNRKMRDFSGGESRALQAIFLQWPADATPEDRAAVAQRIADLRARFVAGESWDALVAETPDSVLAAAGGNLGTFKRGEAVAEIEGPAFAVQVGQVTEPIAVGSGVLLVRVASLEAGVAPTLEQLRPQLVNELTEAKLERELELWYNQTLRRSSVKILLEPVAP